MIKNLLKEYKTEKKELLKNWSEADFDLHKKQIYYTIKHNFYNNIKILNTDAPAYITQFTTGAALEDLFGLPYTSSSSFAAVWNTNASAKANLKNINLYFRGAAIDADGDAVLIFEDDKTNIFYFKNFDFLNFMKNAKQIERAQEVATFHEEANKIINAFYNTVKQFDGKQYGKQTAEKINSIIKEQTKNLKTDFYYSNYNSCLTVYSFLTSGRIEDSVYITITDQYNTIKAPEPNNNNYYKVLNAGEVFKELEKTKSKINKLAPELLTQIEKYNNLKQYLHNENNKTQIFNFELYTIAKYGVEG